MGNSVPRTALCPQELPETLGQSRLHTWPAAAGVGVGGGEAALPVLPITVPRVTVGPWPGEVNVPHVPPRANLRGDPWLERLHRPPLQTEVSAVRPEVSQTILSTNYSPPEKVLTNRRDLRPADGSYQAPRDAWRWVPLLPPPSQAALARFTESFPDPVKCACKPSFWPGVLEITWQPLELGSLAPNLASDLAPGAPT
ncbi:hypothetical protein J1605_019666 [Eschrichtius robustus]|uniref:Uncharacterized protein n=1 Tax=Eschrichtius robustus TaxID=9764 RepID=A0AB34HLK1_ESCRO|nr:hypothetical protein J1605_019666 [Eschrichtius robustus]